MRLRLFFISLFLLCQVILPCPAHSKPLILQLKWFHSFQFAGYYAAQQKGYYRNVGLDVKIKERSPGMNVLEELQANRADFITELPGVLIARNQGSPVVALAAIMQHSPLVILSLQHSGINAPHDLIGRKVMFSSGINAELQAVMLNEHINTDKILVKEHSWDINDLITGRIDAMSAYSINEPYTLLKKAIPFSVIRPSTYGIDFYGDCLFTSEALIDSHPVEVENFLQASLQGWEYAMSHVDEMIDLITENYQVNQEKEHLRYEAEAMRELMDPDLIDIGHMNPGRWKHIGDTYMRVGLLKQDYSLKGFLYSADQKRNEVIKPLFYLALILAGLGGLIALILGGFNRKLRIAVNKRTAELKLSEQRFRHLAENIPEIFWISSADFREIVYISPAYEKIWGFSVESLYKNPTSWIDAVLPEDKKKVLAALPTQAEEVESIVQIPEFRIQRPDQEIRWILARAYPLKNEKGEIIYITGIAEDITDRKKATIALKESEKRYRELFENIIDVSYRTDLEGRFLIISPSAKETFGYSPEEVIGKKIADFYKDSSLRSQFLELLNRDGYVKNFEAEIRKKNGDYVWVSTNAQVLLDEHGNFAGVEGITRDISQLKDAMMEKERLEENLRQRQKMEAIGTLAGGIAHDFNNILSAVFGFTELALEQMPKDDNNRKYLEIVMTAAERAKDLTKRILMFSRKKTAARVPLKIRPIVEEAAKMLRQTIPTTIGLEVNTENAAGYILADETELHQIIINLCTNAYHALEKEEGKICISLATKDSDTVKAEPLPNPDTGPYALLTITDNGVGMTPATLSRIFEPFFTTKSQGKGTGLGLAVVHGIVKSYGGDITVESRPGIGTTFRVFFPLTKEQDLHEFHLGKTTLPRGTERILFVDDEYPLVELGRHILTSLGYTVANTTSPKEALEIFRKDPYSFDLLITDQTMPDLTGDMLARKVFELRPDFPVIICTGHSARLDAEQAQSLGVKAFLAKPIQRSTLAFTIRKALATQKNTV